MSFINDFFSRTVPSMFFVLIRCFGQTNFGKFFEEITHLTFTAYENSLGSVLSI